MSRHAKIRAAVPLIVLAIAATLLISPQALAQRHPLSATGFVNHAFDSHGLDDINIYNGNAVLTVPLGPTYQVGPLLSYRMELFYNSKIWEHAFFGWQDNDSDLDNILNYFVDVGVGWNLSFGHMYPNIYPDQFGVGETGEEWDNDRPFIYRDPSGAEHEFFYEPFGGAASSIDDNDLTYFTRDGTNLRAHHECPVSNPCDATSRQWVVEFPNGARHYLANYIPNDEPFQPNRPWCSAPTCLDGRFRTRGWYTTAIKDPYGNWISIAYGPEAPWRPTGITDSAGRIITIQYTPTKVSVTLPTSAHGMSDSAYRTSVVNLILEPNVSIPRPPAGIPSTTEPDPPAIAPLLSAIHFSATGEYYAFDYNRTHPTSSLIYAESGVEGTLRSVGLPTGGRIDYDYESAIWGRPYEVCTDYPPSSERPPILVLFCSDHYQYPLVVARRHERRYVFRTPASGSARTLHEEVATTTYERVMTGHTGTDENFFPYGAALVTHPGGEYGAIRQDLYYFGNAADYSCDLEDQPPHTGPCTNELESALRFPRDDGSLGRNDKIGQLLRHEIYESPPASSPLDEALNSALGSCQRRSLPSGRPIGSLREHVERFRSPLDFRLMPDDRPGNWDSQTPDWRPGRLVKATSYIYEYDAVNSAKYVTTGETDARGLPFFTNPHPIVILEQFYSDAEETLAENSERDQPNRVSGGRQAISRLAWARLTRRLPDGAFLSTRNFGALRDIFGNYRDTIVETTHPIFGGTTKYVNNTPTLQIDGGESWGDQTLWNSRTGLNETWLIGLPTRRDRWLDAEVEERVRTEFEYDFSTGFVTLQRDYTDKLLAVGIAEPLTAPALEHHFEGGANETPTEGLIERDSFGITEAFARVTTYEPGQGLRPCGSPAVSSRTGSPSDGSQVGVAVDLVNRTVDCGSGLIKESSDAAGVRTQFSYDGVGRLIEMRPGLTPLGAESNDADAVISIQYQLPTSSSPEPPIGAIGGFPKSVSGYAIVKQKDPAGSVTLLEERLYFDGFGRTTLAQFETPSGTSFWVSSYDTSGQAFHSSEVIPGSVYFSREQNSQYRGLLQFASEETCGVGVVDGSGLPGTCQYLDGEGRSLQSESANGEVGRAYYGFDGAQGQFSRSAICNVDGKEAQRELRYDGRGFLRQVVESPSTAFFGSGTVGTHKTDYDYDVNGKLTSVRQDGPGATQERSFGFDALGRLVSESHPEKGANAAGAWQAMTTAYELDAMGNVTRQQELIGAAEHRDLHFAFDGAGRLLATRADEPAGPLLQSFEYGTANAGTDWRRNRMIATTQFYPDLGLADAPEVRTHLIYDGRAGRVSRRSVKLANPHSSWLSGADAGRSWYASTSYDELGLPVGRTFGQETSGGVLTPLGTQTLTNDDGFPVAISAGAQPLASALSFWPNGTVGSYTLLGGLATTTWEFSTEDYLARPSQITVTASGGARVIGPLSYDGAGNIMAVGQRYPGSTATATDVFHYDRLSRLTSASMRGGIRESYLLDRWSNLEGKGPNGERISVDRRNNRLDELDLGDTGQSVSYDNFGNVTEWGDFRQEWDEFDRLIRLDHLDSASAVGEGWLYLYDAGGERVFRLRRQPATGSVARQDRLEITLRDESNFPLASLGSDAQTASLTQEHQYAWLWGRIVAEQDACSLEPWRGKATDHLGTTRVSVREDGKVFFHDFLPYGEELPSYAADDSRIQYTGHERDVESGYDYMHARYYNNAVGRFASVDPVGGNPSNPLSWNRYAYVQGNPLRFTDPTGKFQKDEHNEIIKKALPGLTEAERKTLEQASKTVDKDQSKEGSFKHAMRAEGQSASEATAKAEEFIGDKLSAASSVQAGHAEAGGKGLSPTALEHFGAAIHTVTDSASPTHQGFQEWRGLSLGAPSTFVDAAAHFLVERNASDSSKDTAVFAVRMLFESTFGADLAKSAFQTP